MADQLIQSKTGAVAEFLVEIINAMLYYNNHLSKKDEGNVLVIHLKN